MKPALMVAVLMVGCASTSTPEYRWGHPNGGVTWDRDRYECFREASMVPQVPYPSGPAPSIGSRSGDYGEAFRRGQALRTYHDRIDQAEDAEVRAQQLYTLCMTSRGYSWRPRPSLVTPPTAPPNWTLWDRSTGVNIANLTPPAWKQQAGFSDRAACHQARDAYLARLAAGTPPGEWTVMPTRPEGSVRFRTKLSGKRPEGIIVQFDALCRPAVLGPPTSEVSP